MILVWFYCIYLSIGLWTMISLLCIRYKKVLENLHYFYFGLYLYQEGGHLKPCVVYFLLFCSVALLLWPVSLASGLPCCPLLSCLSALLFVVCYRVLFPLVYSIRLLFVRSAFTGCVYLLQNYSVAFYFFLPLKKLLLVSDFFYFFLCS